MMQRTAVMLLGVLGLVCLSETARAQGDALSGKRRVYVLHSGMHIILAPEEKNHAALTLKQMLQARGVPGRDIVALDSPYPTASWREILPREGLLMYLESTDPSSRTAQEAYVRLHRVLAAHKVRSSDEIIWIGHSAGGQMGMAMAHLAHHHDKYPELARKTAPYHFGMVITLGTAVGANPVPADVPLRHYYSSADTLILMLSRHGNVVSDSMGSRVRFCPSHTLRANARIRVFSDIEHAYWYTEERVLERLLHETDPDYCPAWRRIQTDQGRALGLAQLLARSLEAAWQISLED